MSWRATFRDPKANLNDLRSAVEADRCTKRLGAESANGKVFRVCDGPRCTKCSALKIPNHDSDDTEADILGIVRSATSTAPAILAHTLQGLSKSASGQGAIETELLKSGKWHTYHDLIRKGPKGCISKTNLCIFMVQVFATLDYLHRHADGLLHMDLKFDQFVLLPWPKAKPVDILPSSTSGTVWVLPRPAKYAVWPVLIDFGNAYTNGTGDPGKIYDKGSNFKGQCYSVGFDAFRLLAYFYNKRNKPAFTVSAKKFIETLCFDMYGGEKNFLKLFYDTTFSDWMMSSGYGMLTANGCADPAVRKLTQFETLLQLPDTAKFSSALGTFACVLGHDQFACYRKVK